MSNTIPVRFKQYFWDIDFESLSLAENPDFILKRLLDLGDIDALKWIKERFSNEAIERLVLTSRDLSKKTVNFWFKYLCLKRPYSRTPLTQ